LLAMRRFAPLWNSLGFPYNWFVYISLLFLMALTSSALAVLLIMVVFRVPWASFPALFWRAGRLGVLVIFIVGILYHLYSDARTRLERSNRELEIGKTHSQLQEQELEKAREIQEGLLPKKIPQVRGLEVAGAWQPARVVGGDYFDVLKFNERKIALCIGDVVGKGISAALLMANLQATFRAFASESISPAALIQKLNGVICNNIAPDKFVTFCCCMIDAAENRLSYANAGHWPPILVRKSGTVVSLNEGGAPLGIFPDRNYEDGEVQLEPGDRLILYTDGLTEATNSDEQEFGERRLVELGSRNIALGAADLLESIRREVVGFNHGNLQDDLTLVVVAVK
jgi:sigma-B regulation protein RsbU (phosphoserine phosphatase)